MTRVKPSMMGVAIAFGGSVLLSSVAFGQAQTPPPAQKQERIEITGSNIKRTDVETIAPVDVITRVEIERSGKQTAAEVIRAIPQNTGSLDEKATNSFAPGSAGVSLRGLGQKATLVLLNGRRIAGYGLAQNIQETFVDLNSIPASAIERIEVLRDGASAIYGSDAIAGVINIILRKDFKGLELGVNGTFIGQTSKGKETRVTGTFGFGDLGSDKYNLMGTVDLYKRGELLFSDVDFLKSYDRRRFQGGVNNTALTVGQFQSTTAVGGLLPTRAFAECPSTPISGTDAQARGLGNLNATFAAGSTFCNFDLAGSTTVSPATQRLGVLTRGTMQFGDNMQGFAEFGYSKNKTDQVFQYAFVRTTGFATTGQSIIPFTYRVFLNAGQGGNPTGGRVEYRGFFWDLGPRISTIESEAQRYLVGAEGTHFGWDWKSGLSYSSTETINGFKNLISQSGLNAAIAANSYNFNNPSQNSQAVRDSIRVNGRNVGKSELTAFDLKGSRELFAMGGGNAALALGFEFRDEAMKITPDARIAANDVLGRGQTSVNGSRTTTAFFGELNLPITKSIEANVAVRSDRYSDYGTSTVPKAGIKWKLSDNILVRGNAGKGFRAPTLPEISQSAATFFTTARDTPGCLAAGITACPSTQISGVYSANPNLKPEESTSYTLGMVFDVSKDFSITADFFDIKYKNLIGSPDFQSIVDGISRGRVIRDPLNNAIVSVLSGYENLDYVRTKGIDVEMRYGMRTSIGKFDARMLLSYISKYDQVLTTGQAPYAFVGTNGPGGGYTITPRFKANASVAWSEGPWTAQLGVRHVAGYEQTAGRASRQTVSTGGLLPDSIGAQAYADLYASYKFGNKLTLSASIRNLMNKQPPFDPLRQSTFTYAYEEYDARGRIFNIGAKYEF